MWRVRSSGVIGIHSNVSDSYGPISPGIGSSGGGVCSNRYGVTENVGYMNDVAISYGRKNRRTRLVPTTLGTWPRLAVSTTTSALSIIPTGAYNRRI